MLIVSSVDIQFIAVIVGYEFHEDMVECHLTICTNVTCCLFLIHCDEGFCFAIVA